MGDVTEPSSACEGSKRVERVFEHGHVVTGQGEMALNERGKI